MSKDCASEKLTPRRTRAAPSRRLAASRKFSVPSTSSAPHRPQLEQRLAAAAIAPAGSERSRSAGVMGSNGTSDPPPSDADHSPAARRGWEDEMPDDIHQR